MGKKKKVKQVEERMLEKNEQEEEYAQVLKALGDGRFLVQLESGEEVLGRLCGKMRQGRNKRKNWVERDCIVLVGKRDWEVRESNKIVDIVHVYDASQVRQLKKQGYVFHIRDKEENNLEEDCTFDFEDL